MNSGLESNLCHTTTSLLITLPKVEDPSGTYGVTKHIILISLPSNVEAKSNSVLKCLQGPTHKPTLASLLL